MPSPLRIRFRRTASGPDFGPFGPGDETVLPYARARELIDSDQADNLGSVGPDPDAVPETRPAPPRVERAVQRQPERAVAPPEQRVPARPPLEKPKAEGGPLPAGDEKARNATGKPESVSSDKSDSKTSEKSDSGASKK